MSDPCKRRVARGLLAVLALVCTAAPPAQAQQRRTVRAAMGGVLREAVEFVAGPAEQEPRRELRPCGSLYGPQAREIARGPERLNNYDRWIRASYDIVRRLGPLPLCFEHRRDTLTSNQSRYLLNANNYFLRRHPQRPYLLTGYTDARERDPRLALQRAQEIRLKSLEPECRYQVRAGTAQTLGEERKVHYSPATAGCGRPSPR